ncbi:hypothetical protein AXG93_601s1120 [Marchantia polymorpha subsp. ruderalis]|uniref:BRCT domain-containing protein n=1 Tax=Marchantia polymorpha subsp. ruderalis TaxID=1480154 RepID=A0A176WLI7_MARPO|nr:hypothetical protein AXG93_601s1120 [Marchantia polymorpha subsp. ruderalis]
MAFKGQRVMLSRNLVPPEKYDMILDKLKQNEAEVILCSNPGYNSSNDFHFLFSFNNEKFSELLDRGCNVIGPECMLQCARDRRPLPNRKFTCCMSMEGMRILATGFDKKKKLHIEHLVSAMCGELCSHTSMDIDIVVAKDVLAPKYKWSAFTLRKPIVGLDWLVQSFQQHRRAPHEPYRLPPFAGLKVCATGILIDTRDQIADIIAKNGGTFDADLTRECTHLITLLERVVCLEERTYAPQEGTINKPLPSGMNESFGKLEEKAMHETSLQGVMAATSGPAVTPHASGQAQARVEGALACNIATGTVLPMQPSDASDAAQANLADAGETECYLSGCRIFLAGFEPSEMKRLAMMVLDGGGTRHMEFNSRITHVILGKPTESDLKEIRQYALWGAMHVVLPNWLEECSLQKREIVVSEKYAVAHTLLVQENLFRQGMNKRRPLYQENTTKENMSGKLSTDHIDVSDKRLGANGARRAYDSTSGYDTIDGTVSRNQETGEVPHYKENMEGNNCGGKTSKKSFDVVSDERPFISPRKGDGQQGISTVTSESASFRQNVLHTSALSETGGPLREIIGNKKQELVTNLMADHSLTTPTSLPTNLATSAPSISGMQNGVFDGCVFDFTKSCQFDLRTEIVQWVIQGGGLMLGVAGETAKHKLDFLIVPHGLKRDPCDDNSVRVVTPQWIKYCLEEGSILDLTSHVLFQPLPCEVPLPGFERFRFCVSQYADRDRILLYNLCHVLGAKYQDKRMTRKATHLLCMVGDGEKYEAALRWGIEVVTADWVHACVTQNMIVDLYPYRPKRLTAADREAGLAIPTQCPTSSRSSVALSFDDFQQSVQQTRQTQDQGQTSQRETLDIKGKMTDVKRSRGKLLANSLEFKTPSAQKTGSVSLSSQMVNGILDPWDELSASWSKPQSNEKQPSGKSHRKANSPPRPPFDEQACVDHVIAQRNEPAQTADENSRDGTLDCMARESRPAADHNLREVAKDEESGPDVAAAIEGLLAQSSKACHSSIEMNTLVPTPISNGRNFCQAGAFYTRFAEFDEEELPQSTTSGEDGHEKFQESQIESQVVAYDEDFSAKQRIMERVRTRSMSTTPPVRSGSDITDNDKNKWKGASLSRLFKAAAANK